MWAAHGGADGQEGGRHRLAGASGSALPSPAPPRRRSDEAIAVMQHPPMRGFSPELAQEPHVYRMLEVRLMAVA